MLLWRMSHKKNKDKQDHFIPIRGNSDHVVLRKKKSSTIRIVLTEIDNVGLQHQMSFMEPRPAAFSNSY